MTGPAWRVLRGVVVAGSLLLFEDLSSSRARKEAMEREERAGWLERENRCWRGWGGERVSE